MRELRGRWAWSKMVTCFSSTPMGIPISLVLTYQVQVSRDLCMCSTCAFPHLAVGYTPASISEAPLCLEREGGQTVG